MLQKPKKISDIVVVPLAKQQPENNDKPSDRTPGQQMPSVIMQNDPDYDWDKLGDDELFGEKDDEEDRLFIERDDWTLD